MTIAKVRENLWLAWTDLDGRVHLAHSVPAATGKITWQLQAKDVATGVTTGPGIVMGAEGYLRNGIVVAYGNADGNIEVLHTEGVHPPPLGETTTQRPSLAWWTDRLWLAWTGVDGRPNTLRASEGLAFDDKKTYGTSSFASPGLGSDETHLTLGWIGTNDRRSLSVAELDSRGDWQRQDTFDEFDGGATGVSISGYDGIFATWASKQNNNQICTLADLWHRKEFHRDSLTSNVTPSFVRGYMAYTDGNDEIWVGRFN